MYYILYVGAALNFIAAFKLLSEIISSPPSKDGPGDYLFLKMFVVGVAVTFGSLYIYLFNNLEYIVPFLIFGASLKFWAFIISLYLLSVKRIGRRLFVELGVSNGIVAALFWWLIQQHL